jgi:hypothetical protein
MAHPSDRPQQIDEALMEIGTNSRMAAFAGEAILSQARQNRDALSPFMDDNRVYAAGQHEYVMARVGISTIHISKNYGSVMETERLYVLTDSRPGSLEDMHFARVRKTVQTHRGTTVALEPLAALVWDAEMPYLPTEVERGQTLLSAARDLAKTIAQAIHEDTIRALRSLGSDPQANGVHRSRSGRLAAEFAALLADGSYDPAITDGSSSAVAEGLRKLETERSAAFEMVDKRAHELSVRFRREILENGSALEAAGLRIEIVTPKVSYRAGPARHKIRVPLLHVTDLESGARGFVEKPPLEVGRWKLNGTLDRSPFAGIAFLERSGQAIAEVRGKTQQLRSVRQGSIAAATVS